MASVLDLPEDVLLGDVFTHLNPEELARCVATCTAWRHAVHGGEETSWRVACENEYDLLPVEPPSRFNHNPVVGSTLATDAAELVGQVGWREYASCRAKDTKATLERIRVSAEHVSQNVDWLNTVEEDMATPRVAWAMHTARVTRIGCEEFTDGRTGMGRTGTGKAGTTRSHWVERKEKDLLTSEGVVDDGLINRRALRRERFRCAVAFAAVRTRREICRLCTDPPGFGPYRTLEYICHSVERATAHVGCLVWEGDVERDFRGNGVLYKGGRDPRHALNLDPRLVEKALDKLGDEFTRRLRVAGVDPTVDTKRAQAVLAEFFAGNVLTETESESSESEWESDSDDGNNRKGLFLLDPRVPAPKTGGMGFEGVASEKFYEPANSSLACVLNTQRGIPITLTILYCGIARRGGLRPLFVNTRGHFLCALVTDDLEGGGRMYDVIDPHNGAKPIGDTVHLDRHETLQAEIRNPRDVVARVLRNLLLIYTRNVFPTAGDSEDGSYQTEPRRVTTTESAYQALATYGGLIHAMRGVHDSLQKSPAYDPNFVGDDSYEYAARARRENMARRAQGLHLLRKEIDDHAGVLAVNASVLEASKHVFPGSEHLTRMLLDNRRREALETRELDYRLKYNC